MKLKEYYYAFGIAVIIILLTALFIQIKTDHNHDYGNTYSDTQILEARKFVADYDERMIKVTEQIQRCAGTPPKRDILAACTKNAYDAQGMESGYYDSLSDISLNPHVKSDYNDYKKISMKVLSTEL